jgi:flagellar motor protein MotB
MSRARTAIGGGDAPRRASLVGKGMLLQILMAKAVELARTGRYSEAESVLSEVKEPVPPRLDLCARIRAQQGRLREAEELWKQACVLDPGNESYRAGLRRIAKMQSRPVWVASMLPMMVALIIAVAVVLATVVVTSYVTDLTASISKIAAEQRAMFKRPEEEKAPNVTIEVPGAFTKSVGDKLVVNFESGLFDRGTDLKPAAKGVLTLLGQQLEPYINRVSIHVEGHTDDVPVLSGQEYRDNVSLGMARAVTVMEHLRATTRLPSSIFSVSSLGESLPPYLNDTPENRARNRTVVLRISNVRR